MRLSVPYQVCVFQILTTSSLIGFVCSFAPRCQPKIPVSAIHSYDPYRHNDDNDNDPFVRNKGRTDIRSLLTQRSFQSFVYLLNSVRDVHTAKWIEKVLDFKNLDSFHGTGAFNITKYPSWDAPLLELVALDAEVVVVERSSSAGQNCRRGWSNKAGYLDNLSQKKQLDDCFQKTSPASSKENPKSGKNSPGFRSGSYLNSLGNQSVAGSSNNKPSTPKTPSKPKPSIIPKLRASSANYLDGLNNGNAELPTDQDEPTAKENPYLEEKSVGYEVDIDPASLLNRIISVREQIADEWATDLETLFLTNDEILSTYLDHQVESREHEGEDKQDNQNVNSSFNSSAIFFLTNSLGTQDRESSPFRRSNFDLLLLSSTQESIHRVLRDYASNEDEENFDWLMEFYTERVGDFFDGHGQAYGRADEFLQELIESPPVAKQKSNDIYFIDPMKMIEDIIRERSDVAREWKKVVSSITHDHTDLRRLILTRRMIEADDDTSSIPKFPAIPKRKKKNSKGGIYEAGVFE